MTLSYIELVIVKNLKLQNINNNIDTSDNCTLNEILKWNKINFYCSIVVMIKTTPTRSATEDPMIHSVNCFDDSTIPSIIRRNFCHRQNKIMTRIVGTVVSFGMHFSYGPNRLQTIKNILHLMQFCSSVRPN